MKLCLDKVEAMYRRIIVLNGMDVGSIIKEGGGHVLSGTFINFLKSVRDCFKEPKVAVNEWETRKCNCFCSFHLATEYLMVHLSYTVGKKGQSLKLRRVTLHEILKGRRSTCPLCPSPPPGSYDCA